MRRVSFFIYGCFAYLLFVAVYAWMGLFIVNLSVGRIPTIDGPRSGPLWLAVLVDVLLIAAFAVPHTVMARPTFKRWWTQYVPPPIERSTYVLVSCLLLILLMWQWKPLGGVAWDVTRPAVRIALYGLFAVGWLLVPAVSFMIHHFDLFGARQVWLHLMGKDYADLPFRTPLAYRVVRHPLYVGWFTVFWATPTMTVTHLVFAGLLTAYILIAIPFEERNLVQHFGEQYRTYRRRVGMLVPRVRLPQAEQFAALGQNGCGVAQ